MLEKTRLNRIKRAAKKTARKAFNKSILSLGSLKYINPNRGK